MIMKLNHEQRQAVAGLLVPVAAIVFVAVLVGAWFALAALGNLLVFIGHWLTGF